MRTSTRFLPTMFLLLATAACGSSSTPTTTAPAPTTTDMFAGSVSPQGSSGYPFTVSAAGPVTIQLTTVTPLATMALGVAFATWNGTSCGTTVSHDDNARAGTAALSGTAAAGTYCVLVYDSGNIPADWSVSYAVQVVHP